MTAVVPTRAGPIGAIVLGHGPAVVLLHGVTYNATTWLPVQRALENDACLHAVDLPGHGSSFFPDHPLTIAEMADAVVAYLDAAGIAECVLVGNSLGTGVALGVCARAPSRVRGTLLLATIGAPVGLNFRVRLMGIPWVTRRMAGLATHRWLRYFILWRSALFLHRPTAEMVANYWEGWRAPGRPAYISALIRQLNIGEPWPWLPTITQPVHVMHGTWDEVLSWRSARQVADALPHGSLTLLRHGTHMVQHDRTEAVCEAIRKMIR